MNCPKCGSLLAVNKSRCERCGEDVTIFKRAAKASNMFYNEGLAKARVRDLTGAVADLKQSLKMNKRNTNARNLLGLVYYEMGESVEALSEWVLSKHFEAKENDADEYMKSIQANPTKLDLVNQAIKKYNGALMSAQQGNDDLAIIQLKKVTSLNSRFIRAHLLLALLYIKNNEYDKARKTLARVLKIDVNNTTALRYMREIGNGAVAAGTDVETVVKEGLRNNPNAAIMPISSYKEEKPNIFLFVNFIIGIGIGVAVFFILLVPTIKKNVVADYNADKNKYSQEMSVQTATIATLESDKKALQDKVDELQKTVDEFGVGEYDAAQYDALFSAIKLYMNDDKAGAADVLAGTKVDKIKSQAALDLYNIIKADTFKDAAAKLYTQGHSQYTAGKYDEAIATLEKVLNLDAANVDAMYFIGRSYHRLGNDKRAADFYNKILNEYADSKRASEAKARLAELNQ